MRRVRTWLLLLLAALLTLRGAVAATMLCPMAESGMQTESQVEAMPALHARMDHAMSHADHMGAHDHAPADHQDGHDHAAMDRCNVCSAFCSLTPLVGDVPTLPVPLVSSVLKYPDLSTPAPNFFSDGQERPPRTI